VHLSSGEQTVHDEHPKALLSIPMLLAMASGAAFRQNAELTALSFFVRNWTADVHARERHNWRKVSGYRIRRNDV